MGRGSPDGKYRRNQKILYAEEFKRKARSIRKQLDCPLEEHYAQKGERNL